MSDKHAADYPDLFKVFEQVQHLEDSNAKFAPELKHGNQQSKIVQIMHQHGIMTGDFVEYGAGKAGLASFIGREAD